MSDEYPRASNDVQRAVVTAFSFFNQWRKAGRENDGPKCDRLLVSIFKQMEAGYMGEHDVNSDAAAMFLGEYYRHQGKASEMESCLENFALAAGLKLLNVQREAEELSNGTHPNAFKRPANTVEDLIATMPKAVRALLTPEKRAKIEEFWKQEAGAEDAEKAAKFFAGLFPELSMRVSVEHVDAKTGQTLSRADVIHRASKQDKE